MDTETFVRGGVVLLESYNNNNNNNNNYNFVYIATFKNQVYKVLYRAEDPTEGQQ